MVLRFLTRLEMLNVPNYKKSRTEAHTYIIKEYRILVEKQRKPHPGVCESTLVEILHYNESMPIRRKQ